MKNETSTGPGSDFPALINHICASSSDKEVKKVGIPPSIIPREIKPRRSREYAAMLMGRLPDER